MSLTHHDDILKMFIFYQRVVLGKNKNKLNVNTLLLNKYNLNSNNADKFEGQDQQRLDDQLWIRLHI